MTIIEVEEFEERKRTILAPYLLPRKDFASNEEKHEHFRVQESAKNYKVGGYMYSVRH